MRRVLHRAAGCAAMAVAQCLVAAFFYGSQAVFAQQLPLRHYDLADGLAHSTVTSAYQDTKGYLWFGTFEGLSRFDGYRFVNYDARDGFRQPIINYVVEDRQGRLWVATNGGGIARLIDDPQEAAVSSQWSVVSGKEPTDNRQLTTDHPSKVRQKFISFPVGDFPASNRVNAIMFDSSGNLWCLTDAGLYRARASDPALKFALVAASGYICKEMLEDRSGRLWFGLGNELIEVRAEEVAHHGTVGPANRNQITGIAEDGNGHLIIAAWHDLFEFTPPADAASNGKWRKLPLSLKPSQTIEAMLRDNAGVLWLATTAGLIKYQDGQQTEYTAAQGLGVDYLRSLYEDRDGNLWITTGGGGVYKLASEMIVSYTQEMGLPHPWAGAVFEDNAGRILVDFTYTPLEVVELNGGHVRRHQKLTVPPPGAPSVLFLRAGLPQRWLAWVPIDNAYEIPQPLFQLRDGRRINVTDLLAPAQYGKGIHVYEDETNKLWYSVDDGKIYRTDPTRIGRGAVESYAADFQLTLDYPQMITDRAGGLWLGNREMLARLWQGKFMRVEPTDALPETDPRCFFLDSRGWLWIGMRYKGASMTKEPGAEHPQFINYSTAGGLSSDTVWSIAEDELGRMYFGTGRGLDRYDPMTDQWRHFTTKDGLVSDHINRLYRDRQGNIWISTTLGVSRLNPHAEHASSGPAPIYLSRVNIAGEDLPLPETGAGQIPRIELAAARNDLTIEFVGLQFQGEDLQYQYKLEGVDRDWNAPSKQRVVNYARLAPGEYRFLARAVSADGTPSQQPASFEFRILRPVYERWWFLALMALVVGLAVFSAYRYRVRRLLEVANMRTRIATDLHDDIGANLTKIAILSEVARQQQPSSDSQEHSPLSSIARISRESVASMSDIVWAINPQRDHLIDLVRRMRREAEELFTARDIKLAFQAPGEEQDLRLGVDVRRDLFLIFKEGINNAARHSRCHQVTIEFRLDAPWLTLLITDDGVGFDPADDSDGHGLENMRQRAEALGGNLTIRTSATEGTTIHLKVPHARSRGLFGEKGVGHPV